MCKIFEEVKNEGRLEGEENKLLEQITKKIKKGISVENIADALQITVAEVERLTKKLKQ